MQHYSDADLLKLLKNRKGVDDEVNKYVPLAKWRAKIDYDYGLRCKLIHERASAGITDDQVSDYRQVVEQILNKLLAFDLSCRRKQISNPLVAHTGFAIRCPKGSF